jgi:hypothetical protein
MHTRRAGSGFLIAHRSLIKAAAVGSLRLDLKKTKKEWSSEEAAHVGIRSHLVALWLWRRRESPD